MPSSTAPTPYYSDDLCTIYCGDSRELLPLLDADVMVTDPPYGYGYASSRGGEFSGQQIANDQDTYARDCILGAWLDRPALVFGSWKRPIPTPTRDVLIWDKGDAVGMGDLSIPWKPNHEQVYVLGGGLRGSTNLGRAALLARCGQPAGRAAAPEREAGTAHA